MSIFDCDKIVMKVAVRFAWRTAIVVFLFITSLALILAVLATSGDANEIDQDLIATTIIFGVFASLPFFLLAFRVSNNPKNRMTTASPRRICLSIKTGLLFTSAYWACAFSFGRGESGAILGGLMIFLYPFIFVPILLILSRSKK